MKGDETLRIIASMVPNWYVAEHGINKNKREGWGATQTFFTHRPPTPDLNSLIQAITTLGKGSKNPSDMPSSADTLQEWVANEWLKIKAQKVNWLKVMGYVRQVARRTYENLPVVLNMVVSDGKGNGDITQPRLQKFLDQLGSSPFTYLKVDRELNFLSYEQIKYSEVTDSTSYKFHPEFLHPYSCVTKSDEFSVHVTSRGDVIIMDSDGMIAAKRKGHWKLYEVKTFKNTLADILGYSVGSNVFEVLFDLSFKRHGALLVFDPEGAVRKNIQNEESIITGDGFPKPGSGQALIADQMKCITFGGGVGTAIQNKRLLLEAASIDGAILFGKNQIEAVGAIVKPHENAGNEFGARTTAALSAFHWGGIPLKVSSDGEVTIYFMNADPDDQTKSSLAKIEYL